LERSCSLPAWSREEDVGRQGGEKVTVDGGATGEMGTRMRFREDTDKAIDVEEDWRRTVCDCEYSLLRSITKIFTGAMPLFTIWVKRCVTESKGGGMVELGKI